MAFIGTPLDTRNTFQSLQGKRFNGDGSTTAFTLDVAPSSTLDIEVFVGNVRQDPNSAYTLSGTTLTFTGAPPSGTNNIYVVHQAKAVGTIEIPATTGSEKTFTGGVVIADDSDGSNGLKIGSGDDFKIYHNGTHTYMDNNTGALFMRNNGSVIIEDLSGNNIIRGIDGAAVDLYHNGTSVLNTTATGATVTTLGVVNEKDLGAGIHIKIADTGASANSAADELVIEGTSTVGMSFLTNNDQDSNITFGDSDGNERGRIQYGHADDQLLLHTAGSTRMKIAADGDVLIAKTSVNSATVGHQLHAVGEVAHTRDGQNVMILNRHTNDGQIVSIRGNNTEQGTINVSGSTISYNAFSGAHWSRLADNSAPTILRGTVIESIATMVDWYTVKMKNSDDFEFTEEIALPDGKSVGDTISHKAKDGVTYNGVIEKQLNEQLPMCKVSDTEDSKAVYGVFNTWDSEEDDGINDMLVTALGAFIIRIHKDETVALGNWLVSKGDGTAKVLAGNTPITADVQSSIIGKVTSTEKSYTYSDGSYCVPCTLHCG